MNEEIIIYGSLASVFVFIITILFIPLIIIRIPRNYFRHELPPKSEKWEIPNYTKYIFLFFKNIIGILIFFSGVIMLFTPGQGLLTILIGLSLINFPGKRKLERKLISQKLIFKMINKIRKKSGVRPLKKPKF